MLWSPAALLVFLVVSGGFEQQSSHAGSRHSDPEGPYLPEVPRPGLETTGVLVVLLEQLRPEPGAQLRCDGGRDPLHDRCDCAELLAIRFVEHDPR